MNKSIFLALFVALLSLGVSVGCGDTDPSAENNKKNNDKKNNDKKTTPKQTTPAGNNNTPTSGKSTGGTTTPMAMDCSGAPTYYGQVDSINDKDHGGGVPAATAKTAKAGLDEIWAYLEEPLTTDKKEILDTKNMGTGKFYYKPATAFVVTSAVVNASNSKNFGNKYFWVEDGDRAIYVRLSEEVKDKDKEAVIIKVGDEVSFKVPKLQIYNGVPQIAEVTNFEVLSRGNDVVVLEKTGQDLMESELYRNVRIKGTLSAKGEPCGPAVCFVMTHGEKSIKFRSSSKFIKGGDCVTYAGPLTAFPGPFNGGAVMLQLDTANYKWARGPKR